MTAETLSAEQQLDQAISELGTLEIRGSQRRIYFNDLMGWLQLEIERDDTGKVLSTTRAGQPIPEKTAIRTENQLKRARLYYDLDERVFRGHGLDSINRGDLATAVTARAEQMVAEGWTKSAESDDAEATGAVA